VSLAGEAGKLRRAEQREATSQRRRLELLGEILTAPPSGGTLAGARQLREALAADRVSKAAQNRGEREDLDSLRSLADAWYHASALAAGLPPAALLRELGRRPSAEPVPAPVTPGRPPPVWMPPPRGRWELALASSVRVLVAEHVKAMPGAVREAIAAGLPERVLPVRRDDPIAPAPDFDLVGRAAWGKAFEAGDVGGALSLLVPAAGSARLPGFEGGPEPAGPLALYDAAAIASGRAPVRSGRGAPLTQRLFVEALLSTPPDGGLAPAQYRVRLRDVIGWVWPHGWDSSRDAPRLRRAMNAVDSLRVPIGAMEGQVVIFRWRGLYGGLDAPIIVDVQIPGRGWGPAVDRRALREAGLDSSPAYRSLLALAFDWHRTAAGGHPIRMRREGGDLNPARERVQPLSAADRVALAYPPGSPALTDRQRRSRRERADATLRTHERRGLVEIERRAPDGGLLRDRDGSPGAWRILPGRSWLRSAPPALEAPPAQELLSGP